MLNDTINFFTQIKENDIKQSFGPFLLKNHNLKFIDLLFYLNRLTGIQNSIYL